MYICNLVRTAMRADLKTLLDIKAEGEEYLADILKSAMSAEDFIEINAVANAVETIGKMYFDYKVKDEELHDEKFFCDSFADHEGVICDFILEEFNRITLDPRYLPNSATIKVAIDRRDGAEYYVKIATYENSYVVEAYTEGKDEHALLISQADNTTIDYVVNTAVKLIKAEILSKR